MRMFCKAVFGLLLAFLFSNCARADRFPQLLPDSENFELTLREDPASTLPLGSACGGEAAKTLACRAFVVTLKNVGVHTVHLSRIACQEPVVLFESKEPNSSSGWWPISQGSRPVCTPWSYENLRLRPGETTEYRTRLVSKDRPAEPWAPVAVRSYQVRASWTLWGCTENPEGNDCLAPLQVMKPMGWAGGPKTGDVEIQTPVSVVSKQIEVTSPALPILGPLKLGFELSVTSDPQAAEIRKRYSASCVADQGKSMECAVFHYAIRNLGDRPVRNGRYSCSDFSMVPEYRSDDGEWKHLQSRLQACTANVYIETPILPGETAEGSFTLGALAPNFDTSLLFAARRYQMRVGFHSSACFASSDGSFCIQSPEKQIETLSNVVLIDAGAYVPSSPK